ncbi:MAG: glycosyl transferase family 39, partial [uncultured bacterium]
MLLLNGFMRQYFVLILIIIFACILRFYGISFDLPYVFNVDEPYIMDKAVEVADGNLRHGIIIRGSLPYYLTGGIIKLATILNPSILKSQKTITQAYKLNKTPFYIIGRSISATYSILEIILVFFLGKLLFNSSVGLIGAFLAAISILSINFSHQVTPDTALSFSILLTLYMGILANKRNSYKLFIVSGLLVGFSASQKLTGILAWPIICLYLFNAKLFRSVSLPKKILFIFGITITPLISFFLSYPYIFQDWSKL